MKLLRVFSSLASPVRWLLPLALVGASLPAGVQEQRAELRELNLDKGLAISGYDPVTYFPEGKSKPQKGKKELALTHHGVTYRFASEANRERFEANPARFEPAYGGWCAYAMARGKKVEVDPESFRVENDQLLLFYKGFLNDTRKKWKKEGADELRAKADENWAAIVAKASERDVSHFNLKKGLALGGYDPVSYRGGNPQAGRKDLKASFEGIEYHFANDANRAAFLADAASFEAGYGGWCAWAMAQGKKVPVDPKAYVRNEEGLFLFYNAAKRDEWIAGRAQMTADANRAWTRILAEG